MCGIPEVSFPFDAIAARAGTGRPVFVEGQPVAEGWRSAGGESFALSLGGCPGERRDAVFRHEAGGLELTRSLWLADDGASAAVRVTVGNRGGESRGLASLTPLVFGGAESLRLGGTGAGDWEVLAQQREKNSVPTARPLGEYAEREDVDEIGGVVKRREEGPLELEADGFCLLRPRGEGRGPALLAGFLSQTGAIGSICLRTDPERRELDLLEFRSEMDAVPLPPGARRSSEWVVLLRGADGRDLIEDFAARVGRYHDVPTPPARPPAVWCSWYHYGNEFTEADFHGELEGIRKRGVPFDVFLIDDFRPRAWGDWLDAPEWPSGLEDAVERIRESGMRPGFWTAPYVIEPGSRFAEAHPEWMLRRADGAPVIFRGQRLSPEPRQNPADPEGEPLFTPILSDFYVLDPTFPGVEQYLEDLYRRLTRGIGFTYHKFDFMRAVFGDPEARFYDRAATRLQAYRRGLRAIRRGAGPGAYLSVCGGHYGGSLGLADSQRSGADVRSSWDDPPVVPKIRQNLLRSWMNRLWHVDADALMVRRRLKPVAPTFGKRLSTGKLTDAEARTMAVNQYVGGGLVCGCEHFADLEDDRLALYRHVMPALRSAGIPLDPFHPVAPTRVLNRIRPVCPDLRPWVTLAVFNWSDAVVGAEIELEAKAVEGLGLGRYFVSEFFSGDVLGIFETGDTVSMEEIQPHGVRLLRITRWDGENPVLAGTDRHFSGGGVEIADWSAGTERADFRVVSPWSGKVRVGVVFPDGADGWVLRSGDYEPGGLHSLRR